MLNMQNVKDIEIPEGSVRTIHDKDNRLIWGRLNYDTKYAGNTYQQTYSGTNLFNTDTFVSKNTSGDVTVIDKNSFTMYDDGNGGGWKYASFEVGNITPNTNYSMKYTQVDSKSASGNTWINIRPTGGSSIINQTYTSGTQIHFNSGENTTSLTFQFYAQAGAGSVAANTATVSNIQLNVGSSTIAYEPYTGGIPAPNPDYPQAVQTVTGEQTITISDGANSEEFHISLGSIELCKIGNYRDKIFNNDPNEDWYDPDLEDNAWYVHKATNMFTVTSSLTGLGKSGTTSNNAFYYSQGFQDIDKTDMGVGASSTSVTSCYTPYFTSTSTYNLLNSSTIGVSFNKYSNNDNVDFRVGFGVNSNVNTLALFKTWLDDNELKVYYPLAIPTDTQITDATLLGQLNAVHEWLTRYGYSSTVTGNLPIIINQTNL